MGICLRYHFGIRDKDCNFGLNRFCRYRKSCPWWTTNHKTGERCDAMTQLLHIWIITGGRYFDVYRNPVRRWFLAGNWCVSVGTEVVVVLDRSDQNLTGWIFAGISQRV